MLDMSNKEHSEIVTIRMPKLLKEMIEADSGMDKEYRTITEWIVMAIREFEKQRLDIITKRKIAFNESEIIDNNNFTRSSENSIHEKIK